MTFEIRLAQNTDAKEWDTIVSKSPHGTIFHQWDWLKITEKHTDSRLYPLFGIKNGEIIGIFPLFYQRKGPIRMVFSPPPHASIFYLGPVLAGKGSLTQEKWETLYINFQESVESFITDDLKARYISIALSPSLQDPRPFSWSGYSIEPNFDYLVDLTKGIDFLYKSLDKQDRSSLRKAKEKEMTFEVGTKKECKKVLDLMEIRYAEQGKIMTESKNYFLDIYDTFYHNLKIATVLFEGEIVTGSIDIQYRDSLYGWVGNPRPNKPISPSPNNFLFWETIRYASENGLKKYVTMSAAGNKRLYRYYAARFNPELKLRYVLTKKSFFTDMAEKGYLTILKPLRAKIRNCSHNTCFQK